LFFEKIKIKNFIKKNRFVFLIIILIKKEKKRREREQPNQSKANQTNDLAFRQQTKKEEISLSNRFFLNEIEKLLQKKNRKKVFFLLLFTLDWQKNIIIIIKKLKR